MRGDAGRRADTDEVIPAPANHSSNSQTLRTGHGEYIVKNNQKEIDNYSEKIP